tara:strand:+ start:414 stop:893 length:480 start_codon:yes stop_codon:yes gene_type:complete
MKPKIHTQPVDHPEIVAAVAGAVSVLLHYTGDNLLSAEALGVAVMAAVMPVVMFVIRLVAKRLAKKAEPVTVIVEGGESGFATLQAIMLILVISVAWLCSGCGAHYHLKDGGWRLEKAECGTQLTVFGDGDPEVSIICIKEAAPLKIGPAVKAKICGGK